MELNVVKLIKLEEKDYGNFGGLGCTLNYTYIELPESKEFYNEEEILSTLNNTDRFKTIKKIEVFKDRILISFDNGYSESCEIITALKFGEKYFMLNELPESEYKANTFSRKNHW